MQKMLVRLIVVVGMILMGYWLYVRFTDENSIKARKEHVVLIQAEAERVQRKATKERNQRFGHKITYFEDTRTGFCFAHTWIGAGNGGPTMSTVECTDKVRELINKSTHPID